ncbi:single-stranded-DNA-specific exonuclease RecJ [Candidatus Peregrinibacteria bacterium]|nr:single-stranded-DNA-specific exonuclease RecJ [Candidatus Peregrinibacteria bacterium]
MSILGKKWVIKNTKSNQTLLEKLLENRGLREHRSINNFLNPSIKNLYNPFLLGDMAHAVERIKKAIEANERIIVYGDYDVDGITATAIVFRALKKLAANVSYRLPHRIEDGYGLNEKFIKEFSKLDVKLVITVDCGISCAKEISLAASLGIDVIVTDHHTIPQNPPDAFAIIHPKYKNSLYPFSYLTGAGIALKLAQALFKEDAKEFIDLAALGTIADVAPLIDENRLIVKEGLSMLKNPKWQGLKYLKQYAGILPNEELSTYAIEFRLAPRINAAGRISHPYYALKLLLEDDSIKNGMTLAKNLDDFNSRRQRITEKAFEEAEEMFAHKHLAKILIASSPHWHTGIIGLIAGKLSDKYRLPAVIMNETGDNFVGSCRSPEYFNIIDAITNTSRLLDHFGGHAAAAGFTLKKKNLEKFISSLNSYAKKIKVSTTAPLLEIDAQLAQNDLTFDTLDLVRQFEPFGTGNPEPIFLLKNITVQNIKTVGKNRDHLKFEIAPPSPSHIETLPPSPSPPSRIEAIGFHMGEFAPKLSRAKKINAVFTLQKNTFNNKTTLQMNVIDFSI